MNDVRCCNNTNKRYSNHTKVLLRLSACGVARGWFSIILLFRGAVAKSVYTKNGRD